MRRNSMRPRRRPGETGWIGSWTVASRSMTPKIRCAEAAARCVAETIRLIDSSRM